MSNEVPAFTVKRVLDLQRAVGILNDREMLTKMAAMDLSDDVRELVDLGLANVATTEALQKRINEHHEAWVATLPLVTFRAYEAVVNGDGERDDDIHFGVYVARTAKQAIAMAHAAGETSVTHAFPLTKAEILRLEAEAAGMTVIDLPLATADLADFKGLPSIEK